MTDNKTMKGSTRFVVVREFTGSQSMEDVFGALVERQAGESYERWRNDHSGGQGSPPTRSDKVETADISHPDGSFCGVMDIMTPVSVQPDQTA